LCLIGPPDSGKTSWFSPFEGELFGLYAFKCESFPSYLGF